MKRPRYLVNFGYALIDRDMQGERPQVMMTSEELEQWLCILDPLKATEWMNGVCLLERREKMFVKMVDDRMVRVLKIQRN